MNRNYGKRLKKLRFETLAAALALWQRSNFE
jgi:hypothetical protein